jgi:probable HAF family extracellular repeat protein
MKRFHLASAVVIVVSVVVGNVWGQVRYTVTDLGMLPGYPYSLACDINASGQVVGDTHTSTFDGHAFLYSDGTMTDLGTLPGYRGRPCLAALVRYSKLCNVASRLNPRRAGTSDLRGDNRRRSFVVILAKSERRRGSWERTTAGSS